VQVGSAPFHSLNIGCRWRRPARGVAFHA
jgi:hypothetical protein